MVSILCWSVIGYYSSYTLGKILNSKDDNIFCIASMFVILGFARGYLE